MVEMRRAFQLTNALAAWSGFHGQMILEIFMPDGCAASLAVKNEQAANIGIGKGKGTGRILAPVRRGRLALGAADRGIIGIGEVPDREKCREILQGLPFFQLPGGRRNAMDKRRDLIPDIRWHCHTLQPAAGIVVVNNSAHVIHVMATSRIDGVFDLKTSLRGYPYITGAICF